MWIILNPKKAHRFTTKGINLHKSAPTAFVGPDTSKEAMMTINRAISDGRIIRISGDESKGMIIPKQAKISGVGTEDTDATVHTKYVRDENGKVLSTIIVMPDEDGNVREEEPKQTVPFMTGIREEPRDEDENEKDI